MKLSLARTLAPAASCDLHDISTLSLLFGGESSSLGVRDKKAGSSGFVQAMANATEYLSTFNKEMFEKDASTGIQRSLEATKLLDPERSQRGSSATHQKLPIEIQTTARGNFIKAIETNYGEASADKELASTKPLPVSGRNAALRFPPRGIPFEGCLLTIRATSWSITPTQHEAEKREASDRPDTQLQRSPQDEVRHYQECVAFAPPHVVGGYLMSNSSGRLFLK